MTNILVRDRRKRREKAEKAMMLPQAKEQWSLRELQEAGQESPLEPPEEVCPCQHLDFGLLA